MDFCIGSCIAPITDPSLAPSSYSDATNSPGYDAMILNSAIESGCSILWTEDFQDGQRFGDLVIRNPYKNARIV